LEWSRIFELMEAGAVLEPAGRGGDHGSSHEPGAVGLLKTDDVADVADLLLVVVVDELVCSRAVSRFPRYLRLQLEVEDAAKVDRVVRQVEAVTEEVEVQPSARGGDWRRMRGLPIVGPGVADASPGTDPLKAVLELELRARRRR
jgi:hypothetical protein